MGAAAERVRKINLIEVLEEDAEAEGITVATPSLLDRSEDDIRGYFQALRIEQPIEQPTFPEAPEEDFKKWFPGLQLSRTACPNPRWRVLCFANAGNSEDMYSSEGTGARRTPSPLLEWCRQNQAECLAVQLPGRNMRKSEKPLDSCQEVAQALFPILASKLQSMPYMVVAHSVGCWNAFEFLQLARQRGLRMPSKVFLSAMAAPTIPPESRPWRQQHLLSEEQFKEECRGWDVNELVFSDSMWGTYQPLMRADFKLFDQYQFQHQGKPKFQFQIAAFWGSKDSRISEAMVRGWQDFTSASFDCQKMEGHHLWPLQPTSKMAWLQHIATGMDAANT